ncbi:hypothetical protein [Streptomyces resistomycificus]|uniref:hypothetical protein n=1 Tax=Streptomyces resistomycificus TaxID=67356 RepID=UPI000ABA0CFF|nr:hypothetical protein [Streptomyces resistomycificus]
MTSTLKAARHLSVMLAVLGLGWAVSAATGLDTLTDTAAYPLAIAALLAVGLFGSTSGIDLAEARDDLRTLILAVTVGVLAKAALIVPVLWLTVDQPAYVLLAITVAQIDPLSVAALRTRSRMSERAKTVLSVWAAFDDPVTVLLTAYLAPLALSTLNGGDSSELPVPPDSYALTTAGNAGLAVVAALAWYLLRRRDGRPASWWRTAASLIVLGGILTAATVYGWMLGVAVVGLFYRPPALFAALDRIMRTAYYAALLGLGMLLVDGVEPGPGIVLGMAAFVAQMIVGWIIARNLKPFDRISLALGQQNGVTAVVLALSLKPALPRTVALVAPAIVTINILHLLANEAWNRRQPPLEPEPDGPPPPNPYGVNSDAGDPVSPADDQPAPSDPGHDHPGTDPERTGSGRGAPRESGAHVRARAAEGADLAVHAHFADLHGVYDINGGIGPGQQVIAGRPARESDDSEEGP